MTFKGKASAALILCVCATSGGVARAADPVPGVPVAGSPPAISGNAVVGQTLTESHANWSKDPTSYSYQWDVCDGYGTTCTAIPGAVGPTYTVAADDIAHTLRLLEWATNTAGKSEFAASTPTAIVSGPGEKTSPPLVAAAPSIAGAAYVGGQLRASAGLWLSDAPVAYAYSWQRCLTSCSAIPGAAAAIYTPVAKDLGARLMVTVTAINRFGRGTASSSSTEMVGPSMSALRAPLAHALTPSGPAGRLHAIRSTRAYRLTFKAAVPGVLILQWFYLPTGTHLGQVYGKILPVLVASASSRIKQSRTVHLRYKVTTAGLLSLGLEPAVRLTGVATFAALGRPGIRVVHVFTLTG